MKTILSIINTPLFVIIFVLLSMVVIGSLSKSKQDSAMKELQIEKTKLEIMILKKQCEDKRE